ncbi:MAG TPA: PAS domain-containing protein, partial [Kofleriaceae bacterium]|nr:PAS domain-containing protein [Kofleriaceae bacterium]
MPTYLDALRIVVESSPAMLAYWDRNQRCLFANQAYLHWFGRPPERMIGITMRELLGPLYELNLPHIEAALRGERQEFERAIPDPAGGPKRCALATYVPHVENGILHGFCVHVTEVTKLKRVEAELREAIAQVRTLRGLIPLCAWCRKLRNDRGAWQSLEQYLAEHTDASITHGIC